MSRLLYIAPVKVAGGPIERGVDEAARPENTVDVIGFARGTRHLEYHYYEALTVPDIVHSVLEFETMQDALGVPVIDSAIAAIKHAEKLIKIRDRFGWATSKIGGYETPPISEIEEWHLPAEYGAGTVAQRWIFSAPQPSS